MGKMISVDEFFAKVMRTPQAWELGRRFEDGGVQQDRVAMIMNIARELNYELNQDDVRSYIDQRMQAEKNTAAQLDNCVLDSEELRAVAGGKKSNSECKSTYKDGENCFHWDACDHLWEDYRRSYICLRTYVPGENCYNLDRCNKQVQEY